MKKIRVILATPFLLLGVLFKMIGIRVLPEYARKEAKELF
jgi:hypothetical protein|tara:strand:- start:1549 stop:1668 length:120 start_codon:yes stop_codon:yes gene_type:complete